jgi:hypothetical protein
MDSGGVQKLVGNRTGQQRRRRLEEQAMRCGKQPDDLLRERKKQMASWQSQRDDLRLVRCSNCGHIGHNFNWCPFALSFYLRQLGRFRGNGGLWMPDEAPLCLNEQEHAKFHKHFAILSMRLGPALVTRSSQAQKATVSHCSQALVSHFQSPL